MRQKAFLGWQLLYYLILEISHASFLSKITQKPLPELQQRSFFIHTPKVRVCILIGWWPCDIMALGLIRQAFLVALQPISVVDAFPRIIGGEGYLRQRSAFKDSSFVHISNCPPSHSAYGAGNTNPPYHRSNTSSEPSCR